MKISRDTAGRSTKRKKKHIANIFIALRVHDDADDVLGQHVFEQETAHGCRHLQLVHLLLELETPEKVQPRVDLDLYIHIYE